MKIDLKLKKRAMGIAVGAFAFLVPFIALRRVVLEPDRWHILGDSPILYYPDFVYLYDSLRLGQFPLWDPFERLGDPFFTDPQSGLFYPINYLFFAIASVVGELDYPLFEFKAIAHIGAASLGMFVLMRRAYKVERAAALCAAITFSLGPFFASHLAHCLIWPIAYFPWLALALFELRRTGRLEWCAGAAVLTGFALTAQAPPAAYYVLIACSLFGGFLLLYGERDWAARWRFLLLGLLALGLGFAFALPVLVPGFEHLEHSVLTERSFKYVSVYAYKLEQRELLWSLTRQHEEKWIFFGALPLVLCGFFVLHPHRRVLIHGAFWLGLGVLGLTLITDKLPVLRWWYEYAPGGDLFRIAPRYIALTQFAVSILVGFGCSGLLRPARALLGRLPLRFLGKDPARSWAIALSPLIAAWFLYSGLTPHLGVYILKARSKPILHQDWKAPDLVEAKRDWRVLNDGYIAMGGGDRFRLRDARGYNTNFVTHRHRRFLHHLRPNKKYALLDLVGVRLYAQHPKNQRAAVRRIANAPGYEEVRDHLWRREDVMPAGFFVAEARVVANRDEAERDTVQRRAFRDYVTLERDKLSPELYAAFERVARTPARRLGPETAEHFAAARQISLDPNETTFEVDAPHDGVFVHNAIWYPGWVAYVDGERAETTPANFLQKAVPISKGKHTVTLRFETTWMRLPYTAALTALLVTALLLGWGPWRARRRRRLSAAG